MEQIGQIAVLGAGTMGSRIAAQLGAAGVSVLLLDITVALAREGARREQAGPLITTGSFAAQLPQLAECDWVIEAVSENLAIKRDLWAQASPHLKASALASTNTSGLSIAALTKDMPLHIRQHFLGVHFFNPPAKLRLVELIRGADTLPQVALLANAFVTERLGKIVVEAKDTPNFIANRVGAFFSATTQRLAVEGGFTVEEVDELTGPLIGLPKSGTYRLMDVIGLDVWAQVMRTLEHTDPVFRPQPYFTEMLRRGLLGQKRGAGFYRKLTVNGESVIEALDLNTFEYHPVQTKPSSWADIGDLEERLKAILLQPSRESDFIARLLGDLTRYCAEVGPEFANSPEDIDRAMQWGYGWTLGPGKLSELYHSVRHAR